MQAIQTGARGFAFFVQLNSDRVLYLATVAFALAAGGYLGHQFLLTP